MKIAIFRLDGFTYAVSSLWRDALTRGRVSLSKTFPQELADRDPRLNRYVLESFKPIDQITAMEKLQSGQLDFVLGHWHNRPRSPEDGLTQGGVDSGWFIQAGFIQAEFTQEIVAYDGLVVFVAFSDPQRERSVPMALNGKITLNSCVNSIRGK